MLVLELYVTLMPVIFAGVANMIFCKSSSWAWANHAMDGGLCLADGQPVFGPNKTWKGFLGMIIFTASFQLIWGQILSLSDQVERLHLLYQVQSNSLSFNLLLGALLGLAYVVAELPNSFIKRRLGIKAGKLAEDHWKVCFFLIDQIDSLIGCALVLALFRPLSLALFAAILALGALTHIAVNHLLYLTKLRRNHF